MSTGPVSQFVDYQEGSDTGANDPSAIQPILNGEDVVGAQTPAAGDGVLNRPAQNLRTRTEYLRGVLEDTLYLRDADRGGLALAGPGVVSWGGPLTGGGSGILTISDNLYLVPFVTPGQVQLPPVPPVASKFGTLTLRKADGAPGIIVQSQRRSYAGGDRINLTVVAGGAPGNASVAIPPDKPQRTIVLTANQPTLATAVAALNGVQADTPATQLFSAALAPGALGTDLLLTPQAKQFVSGNYDAEAHTLTPANLAAFFATPANRLDEGDSLCIQYASINDPLPGPPLGGRRQSLPENNNTTIPPGSFFNSRLNPERLVNAIPLGKVIGGRFIFSKGPQLVPGATNIDLGVVGAGSVSFPAGPAWADGTANPPTTVAGELDKIISDLASVLASSDGADKLGVKPNQFTFGALATQTLSQRLAALDQAKANLKTPNAFALDGDDVPSLAMAFAPKSAFKLWTAFTGASNTPIRIYASATGGYFLTANAEWLPATGRWHQSKPTAQSYGLYFDLSSFSLKNQPAGAPDWTFPAWVTSVAESNGTFQLSGVLTAAGAAFSAGNPGSSFAAAGAGITPAFHFGTGTGVIQPTLLSGRAGVVYRFRIAVGGPPGTATYQLSVDGGVTFSVPTPVAPSAITPDGTVSYTASGNFVAGEVYYFASLGGFIGPTASYNGAPAGIVFLSGSPKTLGSSLTIRMTVAGGPGTAQYELIDNSGNLLETGIVPANGSTSSLLVSVNFAGTFNGGDRFTFVSDVADLAQFQDKSLKPRSTVGHLGLIKSSRNAVVIEEPLMGQNVQTTGGVLQGAINNRLQYYLNAAGGTGTFSNIIFNSYTSQAPFAPVLQFDSDNTPASSGVVYSPGPILAVNGFTEAVFEVDFALINPTNTAFTFGFTDQPLAQFAGNTQPNCRAWFYVSLTGTTWHCLAATGKTLVDIDTGIPVDNSWHSFGIELYGVGTLYSGMIRWFIDDVMVAVDKTVVPVGLLSMSYFLSNQGNNHPAQGGSNGSGGGFAQLYVSVSRN